MKKTFILIIVILILGLVGEGIKLADKNLKLELIGDSEVQVEVNSEYNDSGAEARFFNKDMTSKIKRTGKVDTSKLGEYEIKYEFQDREVIRKVIVKDTQKPEITLKGSESVTIPYDTKYQEDGYTATDNYDGDITQNVEISGETVNDITKKIIYTVKDSSGNETTKERIIITEPKKEEQQIVEPSTSNNDGKSVIYLTFDDGPSRSITPHILDILKEENVKATFFVLGTNTKYNPELVKREFDEGHYIANHGYTHKYSTVYASPEATLDEYNFTQQAIRDALGNQNYKSKVFRFPGGSNGGHYHEAKQNSKAFLRESGIVHLDWNCLSKDAEGANSKETLMQNIIDTMGDKDSVVILMHDASDKILTYEMLEKLKNYFPNCYICNLDGKVIRK